MALDYRALGLICGIEIHQQLDTACKLFCGCPTKHREVEESNFEFFRYLRPSRSELGEIDRAALEEVLVTRRFHYKSHDSTCLVEADEEPPREINAEALEISLVIARLLNMKIVDELQTMRKMVIDGSNTSGFQRTGYIGSDGSIETTEGVVGISILSLEEEAARIIEDRGDSVVYSLDRLGIPLVEIGTAPDIVSPAHAREVASYLGMILRSTGRVKRGLGTIRQDVNVSIKGGARVEIKGVQALNLVDKVVEFEALRQVRLLEIRDDLVRRSASVDAAVWNLSDIFAATGSKVLARSLKSGGVVLACRLAGFAGLVGREIQPDRRLGSEMSDRAKRAGVGGIFHTDELPAYGVTAEEVEAVRTQLAAAESDAVIMVTGPRDRAEKALQAVLVRAREALAFVPEETRRALPNGCSEYMRPLPGSARMYPETDVPAVVITPEMLASLKMPELFADRSKRYQRHYDLSAEQARVMAASPNYPLFEEIMKTNLSASIAVRALETIPIELAREGVTVSNLTEQHYKDSFALVTQSRVAKEGLTDLLRALAAHPEMTADEAAASAGLASVDEAGLETIVRSVADSKEDLIRSKGKRSLDPLMGPVMKQVRGKADGAIVRDQLTNEIITKLTKFGANDLTRLVPQNLSAFNDVSEAFLKAPIATVNLSAFKDLAESIQKSSFIQPETFSAFKDLAESIQKSSFIQPETFSAFKDLAESIQKSSFIQPETFSAFKDMAESIQKSSFIQPETFSAFKDIAESIQKSSFIQPETFSAFKDLAESIQKSSFIQPETFSAFKDMAESIQKSSFIQPEKLSAFKDMAESIQKSSFIQPVNLGAFNEMSEAIQKATRAEVAFHLIQDAAEMAQERRNTSNALSSGAKNVAGDKKADSQER